MKTSTIVLEVEYTCERPDPIELAREIERHFTSYGSNHSRATVRVIAETR